MEEFKCESCGSVEFIKQNGAHICQYCGSKFFPNMVDKNGVSMSDMTRIDIQNAEVESLLERAKKDIDVGHFISANESLDKVLELDDENAQAYLYKMMTEFKVTDLSELSDKAISFEHSVNYKNAIKYGDDEFRETLYAYAKSTKKKTIKNEKNEESESLSNVGQILSALGFLNRFGSRGVANNLKRLGKKSINIIIAIVVIVVGVVFIVNRFGIKHQWNDLYGFVPIGLVFLFKGYRRSWRLQKFIPMGLLGLLLVPLMWLIFYFLNLVINSGDITISEELVSLFIKLKDSVFAIFNLGWEQIAKHIAFGAASGLGLFGGICHIKNTSKWY